MSTECKKKILFVTFSDNADHQDITFGIFEELYPDYDVWLMCTNSPRVPISVNSHVRLVNCPKRPGFNRDTFKLYVLNKEVTWIRKQQFNVIFFESLHTWNLPIMIQKRKNTKIYQMIHDVVPHAGDKSAKQVDLMNRVVCNLSDYIVLVNNKYVSQLAKSYGISFERIKHIDMWRRFPKYTAPRYTGKFLFFGRLNPYKGVDNLLKIVEQCPNIKFSVVGRMDPQVKDMVAILEKKSNVEINTGYVSDEEMEDAFKNADWVILPYNSATQSGVIIDSYRYSRPVIAYNVGAIAEQVSNGESGYLVESGNLDEFIDKIKQCSNMKPLYYEKFSKNSYNYGLKKYSTVEARERVCKLIDV